MDAALKQAWEAKLGHKARRLEGHRDPIGKQGWEAKLVTWRADKDPTGKQGWEAKLGSKANNLEGQKYPTVK